MNVADRHYPKISVVTPSYNQGCYLEETILSVIDQGYPNLEYIVMDGGSSDDSKTIIERHADRIDYWVSEKDAGQSDALNRGFARATGDIFGWINSDDCLAPGALHAIAAAFTRGSADIVAGIVNVRLDGKLVYHHRTGLPAGPLALSDILDLEAEWLQGRYFYQPEVYFSRAIYQAAGNKIDTDLHYSMDYDLWVRMAQAGARILPIDHEIANFRMHADQKTSSTAAYLPELTRHANSFRKPLGLAEIAPSDPSSKPAKRNLRVGMLNDFGFNYGAGRAHKRIAESLAAHQVEVFLFAFRNDMSDPRSTTMDEAMDALRSAKVDVIIVGNLHGVFPEGVALDGLAALAPLLLVTHDFFWFTGRCPYPGACDAYLFTCPPTCPTRENYPVIPFKGIPAAHDLKISSLSLDSVFFLANSDYMAETTRRFLAVKAPDLDPDARVHRLHLAVTEDAYRPGDQTAAREALDVPAGAFVVLCSSSSVDDQRKGFRHVLEASRLAGQPIHILAMGAIEKGREVEGVQYTGYLVEDVAIARCYQAADVFVSGSSNETFGQTFVEAAMCGCPSIGYKNTGIVDAVIPNRTGWLVDPCDLAGMARRLSWLISQTRQELESFRAIVQVEAASRFGVPSLLVGLDAVFHKIVSDPSVTIGKNAQFGGSRSIPTKRLTSRHVVMKSGFAPPEGPFPEFGIDDPVTWQIYPSAEIALHTMKAGLHLLTLRVTSLADQELTFSLDDAIVGKQALKHEPWSVRSEIDIAIDLVPGISILTIDAMHSFAEPNTERSLYCAYLACRLVPTDSAAGLRGLSRFEPEVTSAADRPPYKSVFAQKTFGRLISLAKRLYPSSLYTKKTSDIAAAAPSEVQGPLGHQLQPHIRLVEGYAKVEGPYPSMGIAMPLAWQTSAQSQIEVLSSGDQMGGGPAVIMLDVVLPCAQSLTLQVGDVVLRFENLMQSSWNRPTRMLLLEVQLGDASTLIRVTAESYIVDDADRTLYAALLRVTTSYERQDEVSRAQHYQDPDQHFEEVWPLKAYKTSIPD